MQDRGCLGDWHRQWCCEIGSSCWGDSWLPTLREGQRNWSCVHVGYRRARVRSGETADLGNCGRQSARLERAGQVKSLTSVYDMCSAGHRVVFDFDSNKRDLRVWELEVKIIPRKETEDILTKMQEQNVEEL